MSTSTKQDARRRRHDHVRKKVFGTARQPRLSIYRSNAHIYAQVIDDDRGHTMASASSLDDSVETDVTKSEAARRVGELVAERALAADVESVVFDRGGFKYAGRVRELAEGAREGGLEF